MANKDIFFDSQKQDFKTPETDKFKGKNICTVQLGSLNGGKIIGIDFDKFVKGELEFDMATFKAHIIEQLTLLNCQVTSVEVIQNDLDGSMKIGVR